MAQALGMGREEVVRARLQNFSEFPVLCGREQTKTEHEGKERASLSLRGGSGTEPPILSEIFRPILSLSHP